MDKKTLQKLLIAETATIWDSLCEMYPKLCKFNPPEITLCGRLWRTAGMCFQETRTIKIGSKFFNHSELYTKEMFAVKLQNKMIHKAVIDLFGLSEKKKKKKKKWQKIMVQYGLKADFYHTMEIKRK